MLPSRGLRPALFAPTSLGHPLAIRPNSARKFSSAPRRTPLPSQCLAQGFRSSAWRTGSLNAPAALPSLVSVRNGSWYAPWSWGSSSKPSEAAPDPSTPAPPAPEPVISSAVPDAAAAAGSSSWQNPAFLGTRFKKGETPEFVEHHAYTGEEILPEVAPVAKQTVQELIKEESVLERMQNVDSHYVGYLSDLGLDFGWGPTSVVQWLLEHIHTYSLWGWGGSMLATTLVIRVIVTPLMLQLSENGARMAAMAPVLKPVQEKMIKAQTNGDLGASNAARQEMSHIKKAAGVSMMKGLGGPIAGGVLGYGTFRLVRNMASLPVPGFDAAGWLWFQNLSIGDPYYILPILIGAVMHLTSRKGGETGTANTRINDAMRVVMWYVLPVWVFIISLWMPAALQLSFLVSSIWGWGFSSLMRNTTFREKMSMTPNPTPETTKLFEKVVEGKLSLAQAVQITRGHNIAPTAQAAGAGKHAGAIKYEAPSIQSILKELEADPSTKLKLRTGAAFQSHIVTEASKPKKGTPPPPKELSAKMGWAWKYYNPLAVLRGARDWASEKYGSRVLKTEKERRREAAKKKAEEYEYRRRQSGMR